MPNIIRGDKTKYISSHFGEYKVPDSEEVRKGSVKQITHDGDTVKISAHGNLSIRFLGIDTPEISFDLMKDGIFRGTGSPKWEAYLTNVETHWPTMETDLGGDLYQYIRGKLEHAQVAQNHHVHAKRAEDELEQLIAADMALLGLSKDTMKFFLPFSYEILDGYGRLLAFVHLDRYNPAIETPNIPKLPSYNHRMLETGYSLPYFIWPNINPFRKESSITAAVYSSASEFRAKINEDYLLQTARQSVKSARQDKIGVFETNFEFESQTYQDLILEAFELRFLSRRSGPSRYFIDLSAEDNQLHAPQEYYKYFPEDRLFVPEQYLPLFEKTGWR